jgi:NADH:ubiquinone oxidoreductase subunit 5 (subunit L)/multisubunit Na+/H+ antiporter MnhA subunit
MYGIYIYIYIYRERERESIIVENLYCDINEDLLHPFFWVGGVVVGFSSFVYMVHFFFEGFVGEPGGKRAVRRHKHKWNYNL